MQRAAPAVIIMRNTYPWAVTGLLKHVRRFLVGRQGSLLKEIGYPTGWNSVPSLPPLLTNYPSVHACLSKGVKPQKTIVKATVQRVQPN